MNNNEMREHKVNPYECPVCGLGGSTVAMVVGDDAPRPGDVAVCAGCAAATVYNKEMIEVLIADANLRDNPRYAQVRAVQKQIRKALGLPVKEEL